MLFIIYVRLVLCVLTSLVGSHPVQSTQENQEEPAIEQAQQVMCSAFCICAPFSSQFIHFYCLLLRMSVFSKYSSVVIFLLFVCQSPPLFCSLPSCISYSSRIDISDHELHLFIAKKHNYMLLKELLLGKHKYFYW